MPRRVLHHHRTSVAFGVDAFTPIINPPQCAILGVGRIERRPVMDGDGVVGCANWSH